MVRGLSVFLVHNLIRDALDILRRGTICAVREIVLDD